MSLSPTKKTTFDHGTNDDEVLHRELCPADFTYFTQADFSLILLESMANQNRFLFVRSSHSLDAQLAATDNSDKRIPFWFKILLHFDGAI